MARQTQIGAPAGQVQSLNRGLALLQALASAEYGLGLSELAQQAALPASTVHRLLGTLQQARFVQNDPDTGRWRIGVQAFTVGSAFLSHRDLVRETHPYLRRLVEQGGETANLAIRDGDHAVFIAQVQCQELMRMLARLGGRAPLHASGVGKALLCMASPTAIADLAARTGLPRFTDRTITDANALARALDATRRQGYALDAEEQADGLRCVAAPIFDEYGQATAAISLSGPTARMTDARLAELGALLADTGRAVTLALGGRPLAVTEP